ncbi:uncharacterized protein EI90DRAFT_54154 [Cantharellus anzutake]|uniref:uncharacterized protein n=1 Tax=Cantharellus anzutake TaxID=1750568 RepID=UPI001905A332|nr:uncharacterized protein EI90DRAFT_54154 [Cantharellus anzutake]KAF8344177.1 hypothetical protein EI90DRAFT_54154 [Cantharellus anzutake]
MGSDAKFFARGKIQEFRKELEEAESTKDKKFIKRKTVLKKIVANITMGNDMSALFPDIVRCMPIQVLEIKKDWHFFSINTERCYIWWPRDVVVQRSLSNTGRS